MSSIDTYLAQILSAKYGEDVRSAIYNSIKQCYADATDVSDVGTSLTTINTYISELQASIDSLYSSKTLTEPLLNSSSEELLDSSGNVLLEQVLFVDMTTYQDILVRVSALETVIKQTLKSTDILTIGSEIGDLKLSIEGLDTSLEEMLSDLESLYTDGMLTDELLGSNSEILLDSSGNALLSQRIFMTMVEYQNLSDQMAAISAVLIGALKRTDNLTLDEINEQIENLFTDAEALEGRVSNLEADTVSQDDRINAVEADLGSLYKDYTLWDELLNSDDEMLLDSSGEAILGRSVYASAEDVNELESRTSAVESLIQNLIKNDTSAEMAADVDAVIESFNSLRSELYEDQTLTDTILDSDGNALLNSSGNALESSLILIDGITFSALEKRVSLIETTVSVLLHAYNSTYISDMGDAKNRLTDLEEALAEIVSPADWSDAESLILPEPQCAIVNISGIDSWPTSKLVDKKAWLEFWDCQGNYFKKRILISAQGSSSMNYVKKNASCDICNDEWEGDDTFSIKFGEWVEQDSFHFKAFYTDYFRGVGICSYHLMDEIVKTRGLYYDRPWKKALVDFDSIGTASNAFGGITDNALELDTGARNWPDGFPCIFYLNGDFYGIYTWQIKKHRDNFHMTKDEATHVWLDGTINATTLLGGTPDWTSWEVRNPKNLYLMDGTEYNADTNIGELIDDTSEYYSLDSDSSKVTKRKKTTAKVKAYIIALSNVMTTIQEAKTAYEDAGKTEEALAVFKEVFETYFDIENQIDYLILMDVIQNGDAFAKNWQWATYDGVKWYLCPYDLDQSFGAYYLGDRIGAPMTSHINNSSDRPSYYVIYYYFDELKAGYAELRDAGIIDAEHIVGLVNTWTKRIGLDMYEKEFDKWSDCMCHGESVLNDGWELVEGEMGTSSTYDETTTYAEGDTCTYGLSSHMGYFTFRATAEVTGIAPVKTWKHHDSIWRVRKWLVKKISNLDTLYGYSAN